MAEPLTDKDLRALHLTASHPAEVVDAGGNVVGEMPGPLERRLLATIARLQERVEETRGRGVWLWGQLQDTATAIVRLTIDGIRLKDAQLAEAQGKTGRLREKLLRPNKRLHQYEADIHQSDCGACDLLAILKGE